MSEQEKYAEEYLRPRYYEGRFLRSVDFNREQRYHMDRLRRHGRDCHTPGIVKGLEIEAHVGDNQAKVGFGWAIDREGRSVVLADKMDVPLEGHNGQAVLIILQYDERAVHIDEANKSQQLDLAEMPAVLVIEESQRVAPDAIMLGRLELDSLGRIKKGAGENPVDVSVRRSSGVNIPDNFAIRTLKFVGPNLESAQWPTLTSPSARKLALDGVFQAQELIGKLPEREVGARQLRWQKLHCEFRPFKLTRNQRQTTMIDAADPKFLGSLYSVAITNLVVEVKGGAAVGEDPKGVVQVDTGFARTATGTLEVVAIFTNVGDMAIEVAEWSAYRLER